MDTPRLDLDRFLQIPRLEALDVSPDGRTLVLSIARLAKDGKKLVRDLWAVPADGQGAPWRLTFGECSDRAPRFLGDGSLLFLSERPDPEPTADGSPPDEPAPQLWLLPPHGEPRALTRRPGGIAAFVAARSGAVAFRAAVHPGAADESADRESEAARKKSGHQGLVYDRLPIRFWDRFYGPRAEHLFFAASAAEAGRARDLSPEATLEHDDLGFDLSPDGRWLVASDRRRDDDGRFYENLRLFDLAAGTSRLLTDERNSYVEPRFAPDGRSVVAICHENQPGRSGRQWLVQVAVGGDPTPRRLTEALDLWPESPVFAADGQSVFFLADERGHHPLYRLRLADLSLTRLTGAGSFAAPSPAPAGGRIFALGSRFDRPPEPVSLAIDAAEQEPAPLGHIAGPAVTGLGLRPAESLTARGPGGREVHSWLMLPDGPAPAAGFPLLLWVHGGPLGAWADGWHWRWNPQLFTARGYAVLQPNPRISTGYGQAFIEEGFGRWGAEPYQDLMAAVEAAARRPDIDGGRLAAMGGSFGGYMANWIAGREKRFRCIVSHAGLWHLTGFHGTTDFGPEWEREFGGDPYRNPELYERWSPHRAVRDIATPMLIVHGEKDYRVPVSEAFQLFTALNRLGVPSRLLYFPDENHWILRPPNIRQWHETIWAFLAEHLA